MLRFSAVVCISLVIVQTLGQSCPDVTTISPFNATRYAGKWYEIEKYPFIFETGQRCVTAEYSLNPNGTVNVINTGYTLFNIPLSITGLATPNPSNPSNLTVSFSGFGDNGRYWVLDTDYDNYSLVYSCFQIPIIPIRIENAWILARSKTLSLTKRTDLKAILAAKGSATNTFYSTLQDCTFSY